MPDEAEKGVPVSKSARMPPTGADSSTPSDGDEGEFEIAVEREQQKEDQEQGQRQNNAQLMAGGGVFGIFAAPVGAIAPRQGDFLLDLLDGVLDRAGKVAALHRELHADIARIVLAIDEGGAVGHLISASSFSGICWPAGVVTGMLPISSGLSRYCCSSRTTRSNCFSCCTTWVATSPPTAASISLLMSSTLRP